MVDKNKLGALSSRLSWNLVSLQDIPGDARSLITSGNFHPNPPTMFHLVQTMVESNYRLHSEMGLILGL